MSAAQEHVSAHEDSVRAVLGGVYRRHGGRYFADSANPLCPTQEGDEEGDSVQQFVRVQTMRALFADFFKEGYDPARVMRRVYGLAKAYYPDLLGKMSDQELGLMFSETRAAVSWRRDQLVTKRLAAAGFHGTHVRCQKTETARKRYSRAQVGNKNRVNGTRRAAAAA